MNSCTIRKFNAKSPLAIVIAAFGLLLTFHVQSFAQSKTKINPTKKVTDTLVAKKKADTIITAPKPKIIPDTTVSEAKPDSVIHVDTLIMSKDSVDAVIKYHAEDSAVMQVSNKNLFLYGKAKADYKDNNLEAAVIQFDQEAQTVKAYGSLDSSGNPRSKPQFKQGDIETISDSIIFNMKNGKGLTKNTFLQQGEIFLNANKMKKINANEMFAQGARFTTCNLDTPHFAFRTKRMKIVNNKIGVTGRVYPEIEQIPIPMIFIPFGIFPLNSVRHSGILFPSFTSSEDFGLGLEGLGYYKVLSEYADITIRSNLYSYGGYNINLNSKYIKRYKYTGNLNLSFQHTVSLNRSTSSIEEYNRSQSYMINWTHSRDNRARPGTSFAANVNFGSTQYNQSLLNNPYQNYNNQLSSSINYSKDWKGKYNLSLNINHNQNSVSRVVNLNLPTANFNVNTIYPFQKKDQIGGGKWYEKLGIGYSGNIQDLISFVDTTFSMKKLLDTLQWGAQHNIPITLSLPQLGPFNISPSISYQERWYGQRSFKKWNDVTEHVDTTTQRGFYTAREMSFGLGINTRIFGTYKYKPTSTIMAIRHEIRPTITLSYKPDFASKYYYNTKVDTSGRTVRFSQFDGGVIGSFSEGTFGGIGFGVDNLLEMKLRDKSDTSAKQPGKKVKLIDGFGFNSSYNLMADSFALGTFNIYARSTLFEKVNISASAVLDPYAVDSKGYRVNTLLFDPKHFKIGRITGGNLAISTSFKSKSKDGKDDKTRQMPVDPFMTPDEQQRQLQYARSNPAEFTDFNIPWTLTLSYSLNFNRTIKPDYSGFETKTYSSLNFNGDFSLTPKWKVGSTGYYDVTTQSLQQLSAFITREMHCWQLSINVTPIGLYRSFSIMISPKSGILRDLKINRSRTFSSY